MLRCPKGAHGHPGMRDPTIYNLLLRQTGMPRCPRGADGHPGMRDLAMHGCSGHAALSFSIHWIFLYITM
jgi:hypothetical protein